MKSNDAQIILHGW